VAIAEAALGQAAPGVTAVCRAPLRGPPAPLSLACHPEDGGRALAVYSQRPAVEPPKRALKSNCARRKLPRNNAARLERLWGIFGIAFDISDGHETAHETAFVDRMRRRSQDGRRAGSWLTRAQCAALCGHGDVLLAPLRAQ